MVRKKQPTAASAKKDASTGADLNMPQKDLPQALVETSWRVAIAFLVPSILGIWLDGKYNKEPMFTLIGVFLALASVAAVVMRYVSDNFKDNKESK